MSKVVKIISGGQTGADRAALDFALLQGITHGGWCPRGRVAEDGALPDRYLLTPTPLADYNQRTEWNVRDSDATVIFSLHAILTGGSLMTRDFAKSWNKPVIHISRDSMLDPVEDLRIFLKTYHPAILNVAGPRTSKEPEVYAFVLDVLSRVGLEYFDNDH